MWWTSIFDQDVFGGPKMICSLLGLRNSEVDDLDAIQGIGGMHSARGVPSVAECCGAIRLQQ